MSELRSFNVASLAECCSSCQSDNGCRTSVYYPFFGLCKHHHLVPEFRDMSFVERSPFSGESAVITIVHQNVS